jgi:hypothetical protein
MDKVMRVVNLPWPLRRRGKWFVRFLGLEPPPAPPKEGRMVFEVIRL